MDDKALMRLALRQAAMDDQEVPVGAVIALDGRVVASAHNEQVALNCALAHAEVLAIQRAQAAMGQARLKGCTLYVTLEPCPMCAGAIIMAGLARCVYAAFDSQYGCCGSLYALPMDPAFHHRVPCEGGLMEEEASALLRDFFASRREKADDTALWQAKLYHPHLPLAND